jgi:hypothetical protein
MTRSIRLINCKRNEKDRLYILSQLGDEMTDDEHEEARLLIAERARAIKRETIGETGDDD